MGVCDDCYEDFKFYDLNYSPMTINDPCPNCGAEKLVNVQGSLLCEDCDEAHKLVT